MFGSCGAEGQGLGSGAINTERGGCKGVKGGENFFIFPAFFLRQFGKMETRSVSQSVRNNEIMKPMKQILTWNTGRHYTEHGQRIAATMLDDGTTVYFVDIDRMIDGHVPNGTLERNAIMRAYDYYSRECASMVEGYPYDQRCTQSGYDRRMEIYNALREAAETEAL